MYIIRYDMKWFDSARSGLTEKEMLALAWDFDVSEPRIVADEPDAAKADAMCRRMNTEEPVETVDIDISVPPGHYMGKRIAYILRKGE